MADITSANAVFLLTIPSVLPVPTQIFGFSVDDIFDFDDIDATDTVMGVDGILSGGLVYAAKPQNISLQADSPSITLFDAWYMAQQANTAAYPAFGNITLTSIGTTYALSTGFLSRYKPLSDAKKILQPRKFRITWQSVIPATVGGFG